MVLQARDIHQARKLDGVAATVSLEDKAAYITTDGTVSDDAMKQVVIDGGYQVVSLTDSE